MINSVAESDNNIFVASFQGVFLSTDYGENWTEKNDGLFAYYVNSIAVVGNYVFVGTLDYGIFRAKISDITDIPEKPKSNSTLSISPNPSTNTISINYPENMLGNKIEIFNPIAISVWSGLAEGESKSIDVSHLAAGVYFLRIGKEIKMFVKE